MTEEDNRKKEELDRREEECKRKEIACKDSLLQICRSSLCRLQPVKRVGNSSFKLKNAVLNNFNVHLFKYISNHE